MISTLPSSVSIAAGCSTSIPYRAKSPALKVGSRVTPCTFMAATSCASWTLSPRMADQLLASDVDAARPDDLAIGDEVQIGIVGGGMTPPGQVGPKHAR